MGYILAGLPNCSWNNIPKQEENTKVKQNLPNVHQMYKMSEKYTKCPFNVPKSSTARPFKIYPN
jgi:hypothetical protein